VCPACSAFVDAEEVFSRSHPRPIFSLALPRKLSSGFRQNVEASHGTAPPGPRWRGVVRGRSRRDAILTIDLLTNAAGGSPAAISCRALNCHPVHRAPSCQPVHSGNTPPTAGGAAASRPAHHRPRLRARPRCPAMLTCPERSRSDAQRMPNSGRQIKSYYVLFSMFDHDLSRSDGVGKKIFEKAGVWLPEL
jgi:hypothetical protein